MRIMSSFNFKKKPRKKGVSFYSENMKEPKPEVGVQNIFKKTGTGSSLISLLKKFKYRSGGSQQNLRFRSTQEMNQSI
jgi:hypothetical protein